MSKSTTQTTMKTVSCMYLQNGDFSNYPDD